MTFGDVMGILCSISAGMAEKTATKYINLYTVNISSSANTVDIFYFTVVVSFIIFLGLRNKVPCVKMYICSTVY